MTSWQGCQSLALISEQLTRPPENCLEGTSLGRFEHDGSLEEEHVRHAQQRPVATWATGNAQLPTWVGVAPGC